MVSSYTTSFGIEKIGSGEQSGAWGTTTNHNLDLLDRIVAYTSVALSGTTHTLTVREASPGSGTEPGRAPAAWRTHEQRGRPQVSF